MSTDASHDPILDLFHPAVARWFRAQFSEPTLPQRRAWSSIHDHRHTLVAAPTGSGKTLAAFLAALDDLVRQGLAGTLEDETQVVYVSPLKALSSDIQKNLQQPLAGIEAELERAGLPAVPIRVLVRTGDTPASERTHMAKHPPHIVVTTPESLYILLTSESGRAMLRTTRTVIVDEIHAVVGSKRGSHLALSLERLRALAGREIVRIGLSATQRPIEEVARFLVGAAGDEVRGSGTDVEARWDGADVDGQGDGKDVVVRGKGSGVDAQGDGTAVEARGDGSSVDARGNGRDVDARENGTDVEDQEDGAERADVVARGNGRSVDAQGDGTAVDARGDGSGVDARGNGRDVDAPGNGSDVDVQVGCTIVDTGHARDLDIAIEVPRSPLSAVMSGEVWQEVYDRLAELILEHRTTLVFVNTRRLAERATRFLSERIGADRITSHHGSLAREQRQRAEQRLKAGELRALVATASLELGIDIGAVDLVCQLGSTRSIATFLQRVGRSNHTIAGFPKGRLFPLSRDELVECAALIVSVRSGNLDRLSIPEQPLDILAQQIVAAVAGEDWSEDDLFALVRRAWPYRDLARQEFDKVVAMLATGFTTRRGRRGAHLHRDEVNRRLRGRRGARLVAITSGGAIPDNADYAVVLEPSGVTIGTVNEDFAVESMAGDIFQLGNTSWRILRVEPGKVRVEDALGEPPSIPFWLGEAPGRTHELSEAVGRLRMEIDHRLGAETHESAPGGGAGNAEAGKQSHSAERSDAVKMLTSHDRLKFSPTRISDATVPAGPDSVPAVEPPDADRTGIADGTLVADGADAMAGAADEPSSLNDRYASDADGTSLADRASRRQALEEAEHWLTQEVGLTSAAAEQIVEYLASARAALGVMPSHETLVLERFFDETGGMQLVLHSPFGSRLNRAWGLALRKRFCVKFNFELQAAATEDAIVLSLGQVHSFQLEDVFRFLRSGNVREVLLQALLDAPMFGIRWRWNATRALAVPRWRGGRKVPPPLLRMEAEDMLAAVFPDQLACLQDKGGEREIPDHPLVNQTIRDCFEEAMDIRGLEGLLASIERGEKHLVARDLSEPSPLAHEILNAKPYAFLDDAPLEERRTQAVMTRRWLDPETATDLGTLDGAAIERVRAEAFPQVRSADELHDALMILGFLTADEGRRGDWEEYLRELSAQRRATILRSRPDGRELWIAAERLPELQAVFPGAVLTPPITAPETRSTERWSSDEALVEILRGRLDSTGPYTAARLASEIGTSGAAVEAALARLEGEGFVFRGRYTPGIQTEEWCARRLLSRIHRYTLDRLRREIEPVTAADFMRFLFEWQHVAPEEHVEGQESLGSIVEQLDGFEAPAAAWEGEILPARVSDYDPAWLDALCLSGRLVWARARLPERPAVVDHSAAVDRAVPPDRSGSAGRSSGFEREDPSKVALAAIAPPGREGRGSGPVRSTPITLASRKTSVIWRALGETGRSQNAEPSPAARSVLEWLAQRGASFFEELVEGTRLLRPQIEDALGELVAFGLATSDSFSGLRALLTPSDKRPSSSAGARRRSVAAFGMESAGRWNRVQRGGPAGMAGAVAVSDDRSIDRVEVVARALLSRYGVVFRALLDREGALPPWRDLLRVYRRLEARGEIRGGRFVNGFSGEQFALPEAVGKVRAVRRRPPSGALVSLSAADPLNLVGVVTPGDRVPALTANRVLFRDGIPIAVREAGKVRFLLSLDPAAEWEAKNALLRRRVPPRLRLYLGRSA